MRPINVYIAVVAALAACCRLYANGYQIALQETDLTNGEQPFNTLFRQKRQMETFEDEDLNGSQHQEPEETGFWDRVVKVAIKIFARFVEWLNS